MKLGLVALLGTTLIIGAHSYTTAPASKPAPFLQASRPATRLQGSANTIQITQPAYNLQ